MYRLILILISIMMVSKSFALGVAGLYQAQLTVMTQTEVERKKITPDVLKEVLLKVIGDNAALNTIRSDTGFKPTGTV